MSAASRRLCLFVLGALIAVPLAGQTVTGTLQGQVTDGSGAPLPGATVTIRNMETGAERLVETSEAGYYNAPYLPVGNYIVTANLEGLGQQTKQGVDIGLNFTRVTNFTLAPQLEEVVTVVAEAPRINRVNAEIKHTLGAQEVIDKPVAPMAGPVAFLTLAETFAGFSENPTSGQNNPTLSSGSSINFGTGTRGATFQVNGVNNDDSSENQHRQGVALSTIQEFQVLTNNYSAEFGRGYGAVVLVQTKSGTNQLRGDVYGFYNDNQWNEQNFFITGPLADRTRTSYGATVGFPIMSDQLFGFLSAEKNTLEGQNEVLRQIFTEADRALPRLTLNNDTPEARAFIENVIGRFPTVTPNRPDLSPRHHQMLQTINQPDDDYTGRLDFDPASNHHFSGRYQYSNQLREATDVITGEQAPQDNEQSNFGLTYTYVFSPKIVGEFRYGLGERSTNVDIEAGNDTPIVRFEGVTNGSIVGNAGGFPIHRDQTDHQFVYNVSALLFESHSLKAGVDIRRQQLDDLADNFSRGFWTFRTGTAAAMTCGQVFPSPYHAFFAGCTGTFQKGYGNFFLENRIDEENLYVEDNWQLLQNLTLNLGARYESVSEPQELEDRVDYGFEDASYVDPRFGFAYTIPGENAWLNWLTGGPNQAVVRGGWGRFHGRAFQSIFSQSGASIRNNPPNGAFQNITNRTNLADPTNGFVFIPGQPLTARVSNLLLVAPDLEMPSTDQWNITFEREFFWNSSIRLSYTSKTSEDLLRYVPVNLAQDPRVVGPVPVLDHPFNAPAAGAPDLRGKQITEFNPDPCAGTGLPGAAVNTACPNAVPLGDNQFSVRVPRTNERRPDPRYGSNLAVLNDAESDYDAFQFEWVKRFSNNLHFQLSYTYSTYFDNLSEATAVGAGDTNATGPNARQYAWARSRFDSPNRLTFYGSYKIPFWADRKDWLGVLFGGWQIAPVIRYADGTPFTVTTTGVDLDLDGFSEARPVLLDPSILFRSINDPATSRQQLPISAFRAPRFGDTIDMLVPRNSFRIDNTEQIDLGLYKNFALPWEHTLTVRLEAFNITDEVQFGFPATSIATLSTFGAISTQQNSPRTLQVGLRYLF